MNNRVVGLEISKNFEVGSKCPNVVFGLLFCYICIENLDTTS